MTNTSGRWWILALGLAVGACSGSDGRNGRDGDNGNNGNNGKDCKGEKCDTPGSKADRECREMCGTDFECRAMCRSDAAALHCADRRKDALETNQRAFTKDALRWAAADVHGVDLVGGDSRGQEYTEYYAVVQPPPAVEGGDLPPAVDLGRTLNNSETTPGVLDLTQDQVFALEDEPDAIVGQCVFTSWHRDVRVPLPSCPDAESCPTVTIPDDGKLPTWAPSRDLGIPLNEKFMRMKISINGNFAAADLVDACMSDPLAGDPDDPDDPLHDNWTRHCTKAFQLFGTEWRRSDPSVCVVAGRLLECGCGVDTDGDGTADIAIDDPGDVIEDFVDGDNVPDRAFFKIARIVIPHIPPRASGVSLRGFKLGHWSGIDKLVENCRYLDTGDDSQTIVSCDLTAADVQANSDDPKGRCREKYGENVVVHVPLPAGALVCNPPEDGQYSGSCGALPWVVGDEGEVPGGGGEECAHAVCDAGAKLNAACDSCVADVCGADPFCCNNEWDSLCVDRTNLLCGDGTCPGAASASEAAAE